MTAAAGWAITPKCISMRSSRTRPGISAPTSPTCSRRNSLPWSRQHLNPGGIFFYNTTGSRRAQRTACTAFPHGARFTNHMVVSDTPIDWNFARWRSVLENYRIDGKAEFDPNNAADQSRIDSIINEYRRGGPMIEECPELLSATKAAR